MASFSVRFLGCKDSQTDAQALRERLVHDGHHAGGGDGEVAVVNTCCVTNEGLAKSRQAASRAARPHARASGTRRGPPPLAAAPPAAPRPRVGARAAGPRLSEAAFAGLPDNVAVVAGQIEQAVETVAGDVGAI